MSQSEVPVVILCGGRGRRFQEQTQYRPKPMIEIGTPMLAASTTSIEGCPQAADSIAIRAIEERKLFIDPPSGMKPN